MKKLSIIVGLALVMLTAACSKDATSDINPSLKTLLGVNIDNSQSRTYIGEAEADGTYPVLWSAGDKVLVNGEAVAVADEFVGKNNLTLEVATAAEYKLAYPAELIEGDVLTISEVQKFVEGSFAVGSGVLVGYSKTEDIMLKNLYGYLKFTVANAADVNRVTVVATGGEALSGTYAINFEAATIAPLAGKDLIRVTDVVATNGVATVVVAVPAGDYSKGFTVKVADKTNGVMTKSLKAAGATVEAGVVYAMPQLTYAATATETLICSAADLQAFIAAANGGDFSAYVSADGEVKLGADIDLAGVTLGHINSWPTDAVFNGQGFALKNWTAKNGLFYNNYGTVKNLVLDQSCKLTHDFASGASDIRPCGFIAMCNLGLVSGCVNNADITIGNADATISQNCFIGSIVGAESIDMVSTNSNDPDKYSSASSASTHHFPGVPVYVTNDANAATIGEMVYGNAKGMKDFIMVTLGTGVGSGFVSNGEMIYGHDGFAGEFGHVIVERGGRECGCGRKGCLEAYASAIGIKRTAFELMATMNDKSPLRDISFNDMDSAILYQHALKGDPIAKEAFRLTGMRLGYALADAVTITSPEAIFVFGGLAKAGDIILDPIKWYMEENMLFAFKNKVKVLPSGLQNKNAAILGGSALVWQNM